MGATASICCNSSGVSVIFAAAMFSSRYLRRLVPGMGTISSP
ncbi:MAG: hypothetical protein AAF915_11360 [Cyanobacteria bacterium P01_D01_bin.50]